MDSWQCIMGVSCIQRSRSTLPGHQALPHTLASPSRPPHPGNHDTFNMPLRGGPNDFFAKHAAEGKRRASHQQRVYLHQLPAPLVRQQQQQGSSDGSSDDSSGSGCPTAWFLGLDPTPEPGLRSPTNFAGGLPWLGMRDA